MKDQVTWFASIAEKKVCGVNFGSVTTGTPIVRGCSKTLSNDPRQFRYTVESALDSHRVKPKISRMCRVLE